MKFIIEKYLKRDLKRENTDKKIPIFLDINIQKYW